jgi:hypothetical protein
MAWPPIPGIPPDGLVLLYGHRAVLRLGLYAAAERVLAGEPVLYLDGANTFDPFVISRLARASGMTPHTVLQSVHVSRAFTCHQMGRLVAERLAPALHAYHARVVILSGPLETFYDESVPVDEVTKLARTLRSALRDIARHGYRLLCLCPPAPAQAKGRGHLLKSLQAEATRVIRMEDTGEGLSLREEVPVSRKTWLIPRPLWEGL